MLVRPLNRPTGPLPKKRVSLWKGPEEDGITYSLLCDFLVDRERFRLKVVEGLSEVHTFSHHMEYGNLWHTCEEALANGDSWQDKLEEYTTKLASTYQPHQEQVFKWSYLCKKHFPIYLKHFSKHPSEMSRKTLFAEVPIRIPYTLPDGRTIIIRGKLDMVYRQPNAIWIQENKTKGEIDQEGISTTVPQNLQTLLYHIALRHLLKDDSWHHKSDVSKIAGTLYNVIRRPLSDLHAPRQKKKESIGDFCDRVAAKCAEDPEHHFFRWMCNLSESTFQFYVGRIVNPILFQLVEWWHSIKADPFNPWNSPYHYQFPFGVYHNMERGYRGKFFDLLAKGSRDGLTKIDNLFPELS